MIDPGIRAVKLFDFDATSLSRDEGIVGVRLHIYRATSIEFVIPAARHWVECAASFGVSGPAFAWPSVYSFHPEATILAVGFGPVLEAMVQFQSQKTVNCPGTRHGPITYVSFLEVAPWNRTDDPGRKFGGLGTLMLQYVSARTFAGGEGGALGLHSLPAAVGFYQRLGFVPHGCPNEHHELYLELDERKAHALRALGGF